MPLNTERLSQFIEQPTPRVVPPAIAKMAMKKSGGRGLLLGGAVFFFVGLGLTLFMFPWRFADRLALDRGETAIASGRVIRATRTRMSEGGSSHRHGGSHGGTPIYQIDYAFEAGDGAEYRGTSYRKGRGTMAGATVKVEYLPSDPTVSRIRNHRVNPFGLLPAVFGIFPLAGLLLLVFGLRARLRTRRLLRTGEFAAGHVEEVQETNVRVNNRTRYKIMIAYDAEGEEKRMSYPAYGEDVTLARQKMQSQDLVGILYDPAAPNHVLLLDALLEAGGKRV